MPKTRDEIATDLATIRADGQQVVDRVIAARVELASAIDALNDFRSNVAAKDAEVLKFVDDYMNPAVANPPPIAPEVAAPPPAEEPPVFTTVDDSNVATDNSSGGVSEVAAELTVVEPTPPSPPADGASV